MKSSKTKRSIYLRTFAWLLSIWLVLMLGFSAYLLFEAKEAAKNTFGQHADSIRYTLSSVAFDDEEEYKLPRLVNIIGYPKFPSGDFDYAIYSNNYNLIYDTGDTWICAYNIPNGPNSWKIGYGFLYPQKWFNDTQIDELKYYLACKGNSTKIGAFNGYEVFFSGWEDGLEFIPDKIWSVSMSILSVNEQGDVTSCSGSVLLDGEPKFESGYENTSGLPYYYNGYFQVNSVVSPPESVTYTAVINKEKLENAAASFENDLSVGTTLKAETIGLFTDRYYMVLPYDNHMNLNYSSVAYWLAVSGECNYLTGILPTLLIVWLMCLCVFSGTAWILSSQTWKTYRRQEEIEQQRKDTTNAIAHDLKTPLSAISGYAENLVSSVHTEKREHYAARILENAQRMDRILQEMLSLSRLESGIQKISPEEFSLRETTEAVADIYEDAFADKSITCLISGDAKITADKALISRAINNFVSNASTNTNQGGKIEILIENGRFTITNTGNQIAEDQMISIWQAYYKTDVARSNPKGSGLGLSIVKSIMNIHGFAYGVENTLDGVSFWFEY